MDLNIVRLKLEAPENESERLSAWSVLKQIRTDANNLYDKYNKLDRDWTKETVS